MPRRDRRGNSGGAERLALRARQERSAAVGRGRPRHRERLAAGLSQPDRRAGRTGVRRRVVRAQRRSFGRGATARVRGEHHHAALDQGRRRLALLRAGRAAGRGRQGRLRGLRAGPARLRPQERISRRTARRLRRHRFRAVRGDRGRRARRRTGPRRDAAVPFYRAGLARRCRKARESARLSLRGAADRRRRERLRKNPVRSVRRPAARHHRGKSAGAHPRHAVDGDFEQDRRDGGHDRQQVGNVGRLRHALWRHERRLQSDQGHLQDRSVSAVEPAQRMEAGRRAGAVRAR